MATNRPEAAPSVTPSPGSAATSSESSSAGSGGAADVTYVADRLVRAVAEPVTISQQEVYGSVSIGIALSATGYTRPADMLRDADTALYRAKAAGRGRYETVRCGDAGVGRP